ncbi:acyl-CoA carboxylase subunit epsilon [Corynebacterium timonense]|uniref:Acyl-CoA carboxylase epsilon subunit n=1 Tax=Corynebacterium timonense TaxID=441500 RepID=A0A1H1S0Q6_9CORY|nr:acyl-CoA carboxylase subunit epsilon [Corynebacterium timonense]SDS41590.1 Acyl-CoA carboxylase epsilon subunit [Corynebacterium timonense]
MTAPTFSVVKGNPTDEELAALTAVLAELQAAATATAGPDDRNLWGRPSPLRHPDVFNPGAFANITYF